MKPLRCLLVLIGSFTFSIGPALAYQCEFNPNAPPVEEPYAGYAPTGYKGAMERDANWFRMVSTVKRPDGATRYVLKQQPPRSRRQFESIEPVHLGGKHFGVVAYREGCGELLYPDGTLAGAERFTDLGIDSWPDDQAAKHVRFRLEFTSDTATEHAYVRFTNGKKSGESPRHYVSAESLDLEEGLLRVEVKSASVPRAFGVMDLATLREVLRPEWEEVRIVQAMRPSMSKEPNGPAYLVARQGRSRIFTLSGEPVDIPPFDEIEVLGNFFLSQSPGGKPDPMLWKTTDRQAKACTLYSMGFRPLLPIPMPLHDHGECPADRSDSSLHFAFTDADGKSRMYRKELAGPEGMLIQTAAGIDGTIVFRYLDGSLILKRDQDGLPGYRLVNPAGRDVVGASFSKFRRWGCSDNSPQVAHDGKWWSLNPDGKLSSPILFEFSC